MWFFFLRCDSPFQACNSSRWTPCTQPYYKGNTVYKDSHFLFLLFLFYFPNENVNSTYRVLSIWTYVIFAVNFNSVRLLHTEILLLWHVMDKLLMVYCCAVWEYIWWILESELKEGVSLGLFLPLLDLVFVVRIILWILLLNNEAPRLVIRESFTLICCILFCVAPCLGTQSTPFCFSFVMHIAIVASTHIVV